LYERFLDQSSILFMVLSSDGVIETANAFSQRQLGGDILNLPFERIILDFYNTLDLSVI
jgi:hypothetical protein